MKKNNIFSIDDCYLFIPPYPIKKFYYRCDRKFHLDDLIELYQQCDNYAIVLISGKKTEFYLWNKNETKLLKILKETLPNQHKTGGSSAARFGRIRDEKIGVYIKKIVELMIQLYIKQNIFQYKGLIIAGPSQMKNLVRSEDLFGKNFDKYLLKNLTISEITEQSIYQVIQLATDVLISRSDEIQYINKFNNMLNNANEIDLIIFGSELVFSAFQNNLLKEIYLANNSIHRDFILNFQSKAKIYIIKNEEFISKYGELIGIKYYNQ